ncbi:MAG TPA: hypothetical protein VFO63_02115 [Blastocatellia bacterium]|nr:hypothetical protein [Blastocatellia bacterium]
MTRHIYMLLVLPVVALTLILGAAAQERRADDTEIAKAQIPLEVTKIFFEYNSSANDLGVHVFLDGEDWRSLSITNPRGRTIFEVEGKGPYKDLGLTELFFEGAEPSLDDVPLAELLNLFPEGEYKFSGRTVENDKIIGRATLTHAIPAGPSNVSAMVGPSNSLVISWNAVTGPPAGFPNRPIVIVGYQVIVEAFQVTLPASARSVTVSPEFVASLSSGAHGFEVLAIEAGGNQTITESSFMKP